MDNHKNLINAVKFGDFDSVKILIENGVDVNKNTYGNTTLLMWAVIGNKYEIAQLLLENNADLKVKDNDGHTALFYAKYHCNIKMVELLKRFEAEAKNDGSKTLQV